MSTPRTPLRPPGLSVRIKLALSYAALVVVAGVALFAVGLLLLRYIPDGNLWLEEGGYVPNRGDLLEVFTKYAWWAIAALTVFGLVGGWLLSGFVLRPLDRITAVAREARDGALDRRIDLPGPRDELTELADAFDAMLARVQRTLDEERRFAANAAHELRTPHSIVRTLVEVAQADPAGRDVDLLLQRLAATNDRAIAITESLLALARGDALDAEPVDLAELAAEAIDEMRTDAAARGIRLHPTLDAAVVLGDRTLLSRVAANLVRNAVVHNVDGGQVWVAVSRDADAAVIDVRNTGADIDPAIAATLTEPFVRGEGRARRAGRPDGSGLGLAIVAAVVRAHGGRLEVAPRPGGGLVVTATLPRRGPQRRA
jgi:two-component system, OmpR family, sensor histidine kinase VanS